MNGKISISELESRMRDNPNSLLFAHLADLYLTKGRIDDAIHTCDVGLKQHAAYVTGYFVLAKAYLAAGKPDKAEASLKTILTHDRQYLSAHKLLGDIMARDGWENKAAVHYRDLLRIDPLEMEARDMLSSMSGEEESLGEFASHEIGWDAATLEPATFETAEEWQEELHPASDLSHDMDIEEPELTQSMSADTETTSTDQAEEMASDALNLDSKTETPDPDAPHSGWLEEDISLDEVPNLAAGATLDMSESSPESAQPQIADTASLDETGEKGVENEPAFAPTPSAETSDEAAMEEAAEEIASDAVPASQTALEQDVDLPQAVDHDPKLDRFLSTLDWPEDAPPLHAPAPGTPSHESLADAVEAYSEQGDEHATLDTAPMADSADAAPSEESPLDDFLDTLKWPDEAESTSPDAPASAAGPSEKDSDSAQAKAADDNADKAIDNILNTLQWPDEPEPQSQETVQESPDISSTAENANPPAWSLDDTDLSGKETEQTQLNAEDVKSPLFKESDFDLDMSEESLNMNPLFIEDIETEEAKPSKTPSGLFEDSVSAQPFEEPPSGGQANIISPTLGEIYTAQGQYAKAIKVYETLLEKQPDEQTYLNKINELKKKLDEA